MSPQIIIRTLYKLKNLPFKQHTSICLYSNAGFRQSQKLLQSEDLWKEKDKISRQYELIYKAPWDTYVSVGSTILSVSTPIVVLAALSNVLRNPEIFTNWDDPVKFGDDLVLADNLYEMSIYLGAFIAIHSVLKMVISRYILRIYKHEKSYIAVCRGHWYNSITLHKFNLQQFAMGKRSMIFGDAVFNLGKKRVLIMENYFKTPHYLNVLLKLQKPDHDQ